MLLLRLFYPTFLLFLLSCNGANDNNIRSTSAEYKSNLDSLKKAERINDLEKIDSSKFIKAFDDIYFGTPPQHSNYDQKQYSINGIEFEFRDSKYSEDFGLYKFMLDRVAKNNFNYMTQEINDIKKIIEISYPEGQKIQEVYKNGLQANVRKYELHYKPELIKLSDDLSDEVYIYKFIKKEISIKLGYEIDYDAEYDQNFDNARIDSLKLIGYAKMFTTKIIFLAQASACALTKI